MSNFSELIEMRISQLPSIDDQILEESKGILKEGLIKIFSLNLWSDSIKRLVISDMLSEDVYNLAKDWQISDSLKNHASILKVLYNQKENDPQHFIFIDAVEFFNNATIATNHILVLILNIYANKFVPTKYLRKNLQKDLSSLDVNIYHFICEWFKTNYAFKVANEKFGYKSFSTNHLLYLNTFKRKLKKILFQYNSDYETPDQRFYVLSLDYMENLFGLISRVIEAKPIDEFELISDNENCKIPLYNIVNEINEVNNCFLHYKEYDIKVLKDYIVAFSEAFDIHLFDNGITLTKNPKDYFNGDLVDTEPRIVCFVDILGFSNLIDEYEKNEESSILQDIQSSFK